MLLSESILRNMHVTCVYRENHENCSSLDFSHNGLLVLAGDVNKNIVVYHIHPGYIPISFPCGDFGVDLAKFFHDSLTAILTSQNRNNFNIRQMSLNRNYHSFVRDYEGHKKKITSLSLSSICNVFTSASLDRTVKIWDARVLKCVDTINIDGKPLAAFSPLGYVLGIGKNSKSYMRYDIRSLGQGPLMTSTFPKETNSEWTNMKFSPNGSSVLISTNGLSTKLIGSGDGSVLQEFKGSPNPDRISLEASYTPDSQYVLCGSTDGLIRVHNAGLGYTVCVLDTASNPSLEGPIRPVSSAIFNPCYPLMASTNITMKLWQPIYNFSAIRFI